MRKLQFLVPLLGISAFLYHLQAQSVSAPLSLATSTELQGSLAGAWVGTLEYRDFSDPAASTKRVKLPTWLNVERKGADLRFRYIYDDGPTKVLKETSNIRIDPAAALYTVVDDAGKIEESYTIAGLAQLRSGRGTLTLTGKGTENKVSVEVRATLRIGRNILEMTRETAASGEAFAFRHAYTFIRETAPVDPPGQLGQFSGIEIYSR